MSWSSAIKKPAAKTTRGRNIELVQPGATARSEPTKVDWDRLVSLDFETYYDDQYTLSKLSTSEYIRDARFKAQMVGIKIGRGKTKIYTAGRIAAALRAINWKTHALLAHNVAFDGFILSHHYGIVPAKYYDTLSMARGLHSNEIGAGLEEVSIFYGGQGKIKDALEPTRGVLNWSPTLNKSVGIYCANDVDEMYRIFKEMVQVYPQDETDLIHITARMFCNPTLRVNIPRVQAEYEREVAKRKELLLAAITDPRRYDYKNDKGKWVSVLDKKAGRDELEGEERDMAVAKKVLGSNEKFVELLLEAGVPEDSIPRKLSKAWMKLSTADREANLDSKWSYAFAKDDLEFIDLPERVWELHPEWDPNKSKDIMRAVVFSEGLRALVDARLITKSTTNITRAERFLKAGENGMPLPVGYNYAAAHTLRWGGANKMNMQNLTRGGELRLSIEAAVAHAMAVCDSGQIEARVNGWLWGQEDLLEAFRKSDAYDREVAEIPKEKRRKMRADERDAYCRFADNVYGRTIWKDDKDERFLGKVCVLGLGFQMGVDKFQMTLAKGALGGPRVNFTRDHCGFIVNTYRTLNYKIVEGWKKCASIIEDMSAGVSGSHKCISWGGDGEGNGWILLPNGMHLKYPDLKQTRNEERGYMEWSYQSKEMRKKIYGGLLCLAGDTEVLTDAGWKQLINVSQADRVWDGAQWVTHDGVVLQGFKQTISFGGVWMTPDHRVYIDGDWREAQQTTHDQATSSFARYFRAPAWFDDGGGATWQRRAANTLDGAVRLRNGEGDLSDRVLQGEYEVMRMQDQDDAQRATHHTRNVPASSLRSVAQHAGSLPESSTPHLQKLRRAWNICLFRLAKVRDFLGGCGGNIPAWADLGAQGQQSRLQPQELYLGDTAGAVQQQTYFCAVSNSVGRADDRPSSGREWAQPHHAVLPPAPRMVGRPDAVPVYDILNAGPNRRFTVRGSDGLPFVVHNCENLVQALARIIVATQMLWIDKKYPCVMTTHDEVVTHPTLKTAEKCYQHMYKCMTTPLWWCPDMPLAAEGGWATNYSK